MKLIASRELSATPRHVWEALKKEGAVVITKDGAPRCIMVPTADATLLEDVQDLVFSRARRAVRAIRRESAKSGVAAMTVDEIDEEIRKARRARKRRS